MQQFVDSHNRHGDLAPMAWLNATRIPTIDVASWSRSRSRPRVVRRSRPADAILLRPPGAIGSLRSEELRQLIQLLQRLIQADEQADPWRQ